MDDLFYVLGIFQGAGEDLQRVSDSGLPTSMTITLAMIFAVFGSLMVNYWTSRRLFLERMISLVLLFGSALAGWAVMAGFQLDFADVFVQASMSMVAGMTVSALVLITFWGVEDA